MNEFTILYEGETLHWTSPDALMLRSMLNLCIEAKVHPMVAATRKLITRDGPAIDVGACVGSMAYLLDVMKPGIETHCYEPAKESYDCLIENVANMPNVHCYNYGLSNKDAEMTLAMPSVPQKQYMNYFKSDNVGIMSVYGASDYRRQPIIVKVLDDLHDKASVIKVDAEGHDYQIMLGARNLVMNSRPLLMLEFIPANFTLSGNKLEDYLTLLFDDYKYVPVGGHWGMVYWIPAEDAPEDVQKSSFEFKKQDNQWTSGYGVEMTTKK